MTRNVPNSQFYVLDDSGLAFAAKYDKALRAMPSEVPMTRISCAAQPRDVVYGLGCDHKIYVWVFEPDVPVRRTAEVFENQRWHPGLGYSDWLFPTDRFYYSDESGIVQREKDDSQLPSSSWSWESGWEIDENYGGEPLGPKSESSMSDVRAITVWLDSVNDRAPLETFVLNVTEGWTYALDFPSVYSAEMRWRHAVRRRRWTRVCHYRDTDKWVPLASNDPLEDCNTFTDTSAGAFDMVQTDPDVCVALWSITTDGAVQIRSGCDRATAFHGNTWQTVDVPKGLDISKIFCGAADRVWALTTNGHPVARTGITKDRPEGTSWALLERPAHGLFLSQIAVGPGSVWALAEDKTVWFRRQITENNSVGLGWVKVGRLLAITLTVARNGEVFAVNSVDGYVYWRSGIGPDEPHGKSWKKIPLNGYQETDRRDGMNRLWIWTDASAEDPESLPSFCDEPETWRTVVSDQLSARFCKEMKLYSGYQRAVDRQESVEVTSVLEAWSHQHGVWEDAQIFLHSLDSAAPNPDAISVEGETFSPVVPFSDVTGIWLLLDDNGNPEVQISTSSQKPQRFSGSITDLSELTTLLSKVYWNFLGGHDIGKHTQLWIMTPGMNRPAVTLTLPNQAIPLTRWHTLPGHFRTVESASGITWGLGYDDSAWVWTGSYEGATGMEKRAHADTLMVEVYHNQRWNPVKGYCDTLLLSDRYLWSDKTGALMRSKDSCQLPCPLAHWVSDWLIDYDNRDNEGWEYALDFPASYHPSPSATHYVRRRRWYRLVRVNALGPWIRGPAVKLRSLSVSPGKTPGSKIPIWAVTLDGSVLVRDRVTSHNPQGASWVSVWNPVPIVSICAGPYCVWAVASDGTAWVRSGTQNKLEGLHWFSVERPSTGARIRSIAIGGDTVWAVCEDDCLYYRRDSCTVLLEGTGWDLVSDGVKNASASLCNEMYASLLVPGKASPVLARRTGIQDDIPAGTAWEYYDIFARDVCARNLAEHPRSPK